MRIKSCNHLCKQNVSFLFSISVFAYIILFTTWTHMTVNMRAFNVKLKLKFSQRKYLRGGVEEIKHAVLTEE